MNPLKDIRSFYTPIQPSVKQSRHSVYYQEHLPAVELRPFVYCYWELKTIGIIQEPFVYRVVTDGCIDIFFDLHQPDSNFIMGFCKKYTEFPLANSFHYVGIRFLPTAFPQLFKVNANELSNKFQRLDLISGPTAKFISEHLNKGLSINMITEKLDEFLLQQLKQTAIDDDYRMYDAINIILKSYGMVNLKTDINTGLSQRQMRRVFNYYIGASPKIFSKVVRFQNILKAKPSTQSLRKNKLFYDLGYFDQSHFIKDFKNFYGVTPSRAFGR